jgi:hypothetical protein
MHECRVPVLNGAVGCEGVDCWGSVDVPSTWFQAFRGGDAIKREARLESGADVDGPTGQRECVYPGSSVS